MALVLKTKPMKQKRDFKNESTTYDKVILNKGVRKNTLKSVSLIILQHLKHLQMTKTNPPHPIQINSKWTKNLNVRFKILKLSGENRNFEMFQYTNLSDMTKRHWQQEQN